MLDILVVAPHPDDAELGMAGTLMRAKDEGMQVGILDLTNGEPTPYGTPEIRAEKRRPRQKSSASIGARISAWRIAGWNTRWMPGRNWPACFVACGRE